MSDGWNEELVSVVTDYKIEWQLPAAKQDAIKRLLSSTGAGVGWLEHDGNGPYAVIAVSPPRLANVTLTDAEVMFLKRERDLMDANDEGDRKAIEIIDGLLERLGGAT